MLIKQFDGVDFVLTDGNHRYSALKRLGKTGYYTIVWCSRDLDGLARMIRYRYTKATNIAILYVLVGKYRRA